MPSLLLAVDTSGPQGSVALARAEGGWFELVESVPVLGGTFSAELVPQISDLLNKNKLRKEEIAAFIAASGPGSFTGLRVGLAAVKALAEVLEKPIVAVSLLEALALKAAGAGRVVALMPAQRNEVYAGEYEIRDGDAHRVNEWVEFAAEVPKRASDWKRSGATLITCDPAIAGTMAEIEVVGRPSAADVAGIGWKKLARGETLAVDALDANYVRRSDAEIYSLPKISGNK